MVSRDRDFVLNFHFSKPDGRDLIKITIHLILYYTYDTFVH